jgi:hypothetical protein
MRIVTRHVKGHTYYEVREARWVDGKKKWRTVVQLGRFSDPVEALAHFEQAYFDARKAKKWPPFSDAERKAWNRVWEIASLRIAKPYPTYTPRVLRELHRWQLWEERERLRLRRERLMTPIDRQLRVLGLRQPVTLERIKTAYRNKAREHHPDHGGSDEAMARVNDAYEWLMEIYPMC